MVSAHTKGEGGAMSDDSSIRRSAHSALAVSADLVIQKDTPCNQQKIAGGDPDDNLLDHPELTHRQLAANHFLLHGLSDAAVADKLGVTRITIYRWRTLNNTSRRELDPAPASRAELNDIIEAVRCLNGDTEEAPNDSEQ